MSRGIGGVEFAATLPDAVVAVAAVFTQLGDVWFVFALLGVLYWFGDSVSSIDRLRAAFAIALALGGVAVTTALKGILRLPRPPGAGEPAGIGAVPTAVEPIYATMATAGGFGFPSGHAVAAVVVYGGLASLVGTRRSYAVAGGLVVAISLSRIAIGVHYLADVLVGVAVGSLYLGVVYRLGGRGTKPGRALGVAVVVAVVGAVAGGYSFETVAVLGALLGGSIAWGGLGADIDSETATVAGGTLATLLAGAVGVVFVVVYAFDPGLPVAFLAVAVVMGCVVAAPVFGETVARRL